MSAAEPEPGNIPGALRFPYKKFAPQASISIGKTSHSVRERARAAKTSEHPAGFAQRASCATPSATSTTAAASADSKEP